MTQPDGKLRIDISRPKCGAEMIDLEFDRIKNGIGFIWKAYRKCPICSTKIEWENKKIIS